MGFVERAFTPPGTGGAEAQAVLQPALAQQAANTALAQQQALRENAKLAIPAVPQAPSTPPVFQPGQAPGAKQRAQVTASTMLGAAAAGGQTAKKSVLGG